MLADGFISPSPTLPYIFHSVQRATFLGSAAYGARIDFFLTPPPHFNSIRAGVADKQLVVLGKFQNSQENVKLSFYERLFFFFLLFFFFPPPFSFPLLLGTVSGSEELSVRRERSFPGCREAGTEASSVRPVHGRRWLRSHPWMEAGNRAAPGKRLGRWFHLAAPLISLLELVEVFNVISLSFSALTPFKMPFFPPNQTHFLGGFFVRHE